MRGGPKPKIKNPGKLFARLMSYVFKSYGIRMVLVVICIIVSLIANFQGTMFTKTLMDSYITQLILQANPDYGSLAKAIGNVVIFYAVGVVAAFVRLIIFVGQGTLRNLRIKLFNRMESLPIKYFDTHAHGDIMSIFINDIDTLKQMISTSIPQLLNSSITIVRVYISMIILNVPLTIVTLIMVALMIFLSAKATGASGKNFMLQQKNFGALNS